jgi:hypothetical protein
MKRNKGIGFTVGRSALLGTNFYKRTVDDKFAKVEDLEALYLGALAHYPCPSVMHNRLVLSSHAYSTLKPTFRTLKCHTSICST